MFKKVNSPLPQSLQKECGKAAKICELPSFKRTASIILKLATVASFVDSGNNGLDGVVPRVILERAKGFAIFSVVKAGFVFSARAGSGIVIARLEDGCMSSHCHRSFSSSLLLC
jgi:SH3 domain-containing YSC84-like protein 1